MCMELVMKALLLCLLSLVLALTVAAAVHPAEIHQVPAIYVFGDSTVDVGNNNYLPGSDVPRANFPHYGIDFPHSRPTGRFSNGYNIADFIANLMGFKRSPPAYLSLRPQTSNQIMKGLRGVNYASAGAGVLDSTRAGIIIPLSKQVQYFAATKVQIEAKLDSKMLNDLLSKSLFLISVGANDLFAFATQNKSASNSQVVTFYNDLVTNYANTITALYSMGARNFGIINVGPIGCVPSARVLSPTGGCIDSMNSLAKGLNDAIKALMGSLRSKLEGMKYSIGDSYALMIYTQANPLAAGFTNIDNACCGGGRLGGETSCFPNSTFCANRNQYFFWDWVHVTQNTAKKAAFAFYKGPLQFAAPINFKQLIEQS